MAYYIYSIPWVDIVCHGIYSMPWVDLNCVFKSERHNNSGSELTFWIWKAQLWIGSLDLKDSQLVDQNKRREAPTDHLEVSSSERFAKKSTKFEKVERVTCTPDWNFWHRPSERLMPLGIVGDRIEDPLKHLGTILPWCIGYFRGAHNWSPPPSEIVRYIVAEISFTDLRWS